MKIFVIFLITFFIILKSGVQMEECNIRTSTQIIPPKIWYEQAIDGKEQSILFTRFLHNKVGMFVNEISNCYLQILNPVFIFQTAGTFGVFFWFYFAYRAILKNQKMIILILLILPSIPIASSNDQNYFFGINFVSNLYKLIAFFGLVTFAKGDK